jgi:hypothetical protein
MDDDLSQKTECMLFCTYESMRGGRFLILPIFILKSMYFCSVTSGHHSPQVRDRVKALQLLDRPKVLTRGFGIGKFSW